MRAVGAVTVMHVLLFVLRVCVLLECEGDGKCWCGVRVRCGCGECVYEWYTCFV